MGGPTGPNADGFAEGLERPGSVEAAEAHGRERLRQMYDRLKRESYTMDDPEMRNEWGYRGDLRELYSIKLPGEEVERYPKWQFDPNASGLEPRHPELWELIEAAKEVGLDPIGFTNVMLNSEAGNGKSPVELLDEGRKDLVLGIIRAQDR